ncbi:site-specific tyrosine recombinase/integron integrase [Qingrenia yutianensis]
MPSLTEIYSKCPVFLKNYLTYMSVIKGKSQNTVTQYYYDLRIFLRYIIMTEKNLHEDEFNNIDILNFDFEKIKKITLDDLYAFMAYINNEHSSNDSFRARKVASLRSFFNYLYIKEKSISENPAQNLDTPKLKARLPKYLSLEQSIDLLKVIDGEYKQRDLAMFALFLTCGLRLSELVSIDIKNVDFKKKTLKVIGKGNKERIVFINDLCVDTIKKYLEVRPNDGLVGNDREALFISSKSTRITGRSVERIAKKYFDLAGIDSDVYTPHKLRHTAATIMYRDGNVDVRTLQKILGHESLSTTQIYTHVSDEFMENAAKKNPLAQVKLDD